MDIVFLTTSMDRGGAETQLVRIALTLRRRGWKVGIVTMLPSDHVFRELETSDIPLVQCPGHPKRSPWVQAWALTRQLRRWRPSTLVTFNYPADVLGRLCGSLASVPAVVSALGTAHLKSPARGLFYRFTERFIAMTVSNSHAALSLMTAHRVLTARKTMVIANGLILDDFPSPVPRADVRARLGVAEGAFLWLAVGNLREAKDYPGLLEAASRCAQAAPPFRLKIVGGGDLAAELERKAASLGLDGIVEFLGPRTDVPALLKAADAYVLGSAWEGSPNTLMEAMASGLPAVATDVGDVKEILREGEAGFVVPSRNPEALATRMLDLMALDGAKRQGMGSMGRSSIIEMCDNESIVSQWEGLFQRLGGSPEGPLPVKGVV